jgi:hypothetical protein
VTPEVDAAITEVRNAFPTNRVDVEPDAEGGAWVIVNDLPLGPPYDRGATWVGFQITFQYPRSDVYPHFMDGILRRKDGQALGAGFSGPIDWRGRMAVQVSRSSKRWNPLIDTAATKLAKVLEWVRDK